MSLLRIAFVVQSLCQLVYGDEKTHVYSNGELVTFYLNKVGPYTNPQETYSYDTLPLCHPAPNRKIKKRESGLGVFLSGHELVDSGLTVRFQENQPVQTMCSMKLDQKQAKKLGKMVKRMYWYQMYIDELPQWGMLGNMTLVGEQAVPAVYTHRHFEIGYNEDRIIEVNLSSGKLAPIVDGSELVLTYSVNWTPTKTQFDDRFNRYLDSDFFLHKVHWLGMGNSLLMVVACCLVVGLILSRVLKKEVQRNSDQDLEFGLFIDVGSGWRTLSNDAFRAHPRVDQLAVLSGVGVQLLFTCAACFFCIGWYGTVYDRRGIFSMILLGSFCLSALVGGAASGFYFKRHAETHKQNLWINVMLTNALLIPVLFTVLHLVLYAIAYIYDPAFLSNVNIEAFYNAVLLVVLVLGPLSLVGTTIGRLLTKPSKHRSALTMRPIPQRLTSRKALLLTLLMGLIPFFGVLIEIYFIFSSLWTHKFYYVYGFLFVSTLIYCILVICTAVVSAYLLLDAENWKWGWFSFFSGASPAIYIFLYATYYFFVKTEMTGALQASFYFGYVFLACILIAISSGTISHLSVSWFVHIIYNIKLE